MFKKILVGSVLISGIIGTSIYFLSGWNTKKAPKTAADYLNGRLPELIMEEQKNGMNEEELKKLPTLTMSHK